MNDRPSPAGFFSVDSNRICLEARLRRHGDGESGDLRRCERRAREGALVGNDIVKESVKRATVRSHEHFRARNNND